ncbi:hypothetical protein SMICM304S_03772 [Streptomyces microflavus]
MTRCGSRRLRITDHLHIAHPPGHDRPDPADQRPQPHRLGRRLVPYRAQRGRRRHDRRQVLEPRRPARLPLPAGPCGANRTPLRTASSPTPAGPPHLCALAVSSDQRPATGPQPSDWAASTSSGTPASAQSAATSATGCSVPTSWLADWRQASAVSARSAPAYAAGSTAPDRSTGTSVNDPPAAPWAAAEWSTEECSTAERARWRPTRRRPERAPAIPACTAVVPEEVKTSSSGRHPTASAAASRAASSSSRARRPSRYRRAGSAQPSSSAASSAWRATGCRGAAEAVSK